MNLRRIRLPMILLLLITPSLRAAISVKDLVKAQIVADVKSVQPGKPFNLGVLLKIAPEWHIYWTNSGEAGLPTTVNLHLPPGFTAGPLQYPTPRQVIEGGDIVMFGYVDEVMLITTITPPEKISVAGIDILADANWLVCGKDDCIQGAQSLKLTLPIQAASQSNEAPLFARWAAEMPVSLSQSGEISSASQSPVTLIGDKVLKGELSLAVNWKTGSLPSLIEWFPSKSDAILFKNIRVTSEDKVTTIRADVQVVFPTALKTSLQIDSVVGFTTSKGRAGVIIPIKFEPIARKQ